MDDGDLLERLFARLVTDAATTRELTRLLVEKFGEPQVDSWGEDHCRGGQDVYFDVNPTSVTRHAQGRTFPHVAGQPEADFLRGFADIGLPDEITVVDLYEIEPHPGATPIDALLRRRVHSLNTKLSPDSDRIFTRRPGARGCYVLSQSLNYAAADALRALRCLRGANTRQIVGALQRIWVVSPNSLAAAMVLTRVCAAAPDAVPRDMIQHAQEVLAYFITRLNAAIRHVNKHPPAYGPEGVAARLRERCRRYEEALTQLVDHQPIDGELPDAAPTITSDFQTMIRAFFHAVRQRDFFSQIEDGCIGEIRAAALAMLRPPPDALAAAHAPKPAKAAPVDDVNPLAAVVVRVLSQARWPAHLSDEEKVDECLAALIELIPKSCPDVPKDRRELIDHLARWLGPAVSRRAATRRLSRAHAHRQLTGLESADL